MAQLVYSSKINKIRSFALILIFAGIGIMYLGIMAKKIEWLMLLLFLIGVLCIVFSTVVYLWIGTLSLRAVPVVCPSCQQPTKMLGRVDACMHCKQPLTLDKALEGKEFDEKYNSKRQQKAEKMNEK
ncbi:MULTISPECIES: YgzB family protein [unclassified Virgibacillus]|uniref:YgzB family protein n=1 Tax=unclassified Virgibacillus TaxID=2620237 RepID=UPI0024DEC8A4|nr:YgzB family protein [Virgibacillus sp. LDC-1]